MGAILPGRAGFLCKQNVHLQPSVNVLKAPVSSKDACVGTWTSRPSLPGAVGASYCIWLSYGAKNEKELKKQQEGEMGKKNCAVSKATSSI